MSQYYAPQLTEPAPTYHQGSNPNQPSGYYPIIQPGPQSSPAVVYVTQIPLQPQYQPQPQPDLEAQIPMEEATGESKTSQFCCAFFDCFCATLTFTLGAIAAVLNCLYLCMRCCSYSYGCSLSVRKATGVRICTKWLNLSSVTSLNVIGAFEDVPIGLMTLLQTRRLKSSQEDDLTPDMSDVRSLPANRLGYMRIFRMENGTDTQS
ncbi:hypothetical protein C8F04DRAFT_389856 [Mycena alexandri]|uniref:Uncharacterized protein n=1 Tax=Mycena alexandri TaxID=1745969 RepID=A0AAD6T3B7_9AGAR|nr:hypothetical protein C8F04DRAFT_389856 [Mycena alexandri]